MFKCVDLDFQWKQTRNAYNHLEKSVYLKPDAIIIILMQKFLKLQSSNIRTAKKKRAGRNHKLIIKGERISGLVSV